MTARWYACHTNARAENYATGWLRMAGFHVWFPHYLAQVRVGGKRIEAERPYFARYIFVNLVGTQSVWDVNHSPGVSKVVYLGEEPLVIPDDVMMELMMRGDQNGLIDMSPKERADRLKTGDRVEISTGPLEGLIGCIERVDKSGRCTIWLDKLKSRVRSAPQALTRTAEDRAV